MKKHCHKKGFSLIETIIYIAMLAVLSTLVIDSLLFVMQDFQAVRLSRELNQSSTVAVERLLHEMRNAYDIDISNTILATDPSRLSLFKTDPATGAQTTVEFYVNSNSGLSIREGGVEKGVLTGEHVTVTKFFIRDISASLEVRTIKVEIGLTTTDSKGVTHTVEMNPVVPLRGMIH